MKRIAKLAKGGQSFIMLAYRNSIYINLQERIQTIATVARAIVKISVFDFRNSHLKAAVEVIKCD